MSWYLYLTFKYFLQKGVKASTVHFYVLVSFAKAPKAKFTITATWKTAGKP